MDAKNTANTTATTVDSKRRSMETAGDDLVSPISVIAGRRTPPCRHRKRLLGLYALMTFLFAFYTAILPKAAAVSATATNNKNVHAVIVSSSRYWFNYRHAMNALGLYRLFRNNGIPDENIIVMIADEYAVNARNPYKNRMHASGIRQESWYNHTVELDYRGSDVTVQNFMDALLGQAPKSLRTNADSNVLVYVTGHGGDQFFKFQDEEELTATDIANLMDRMHQQGLYKQLLFIADTCQAFTLFDKVTAPNVLALGTSLRNENAYAHHSDKDLGLAVIERWTYAFLTAYEKSKDTVTLHDIMVAPFADKKTLGAQIGIKEDTSSKTFRDVLLNEFFGVKGGGSTDAARASTTITSVVYHSPARREGSLFTRLPRIAPVELSSAKSVVTDATMTEAEVKTESGHPPFYYFAGFLAMLVLATVAEKTMLHKH